jgi:uncharacterized phage protein (predicted DNA packaging)
MALLDEIKSILRISNTAMDLEVLDLIESAKTEMNNININLDKVNDAGDMDPLIKRAITLYCKANFGYDNPEATRFLQSYEMLKIHMALSADYQISEAVV